MNEACLNSIDYSTVSGTRILPFVIALDAENSILAPGPGQLQRFCYTITGVGEDTSEYADLSHFIFSICPNIALGALSSVTVVIDGVSQEVDIGENVEILDPDPPTGCTGLKFDFGLDKVDGVMSVCYSLSSVFDVGPVPVCLFGGGQTSSGLSICGPVCESVTTCPAVGSVRATVCVPVTVTPYANVGTPVTYCCGDPVVSSGAATCLGTPLGSCQFTISQNVCVAVPVSFGANAAVGEYSVLCGASAADECEGCQATAASRASANCR